MAYSMIAARENEIIRKKRDSAMFVLANARVWRSEGWQVTITDADGNEFDAAGFERMFSQRHRWASMNQVQPAEQAAGVTAGSEGIEDAAAAMDANDPPMLHAADDAELELTDQI